MSGAVVSRVRMFAGPNGSGKTSLVRSLAKEFSPDGSFHVRHYVNADDLQAALSGAGVDFADLGIALNEAALTESLKHGGRLEATHPTFASIRCTSSRLFIPDCEAYTAAAVADFIREQFLAARRSFAFETVMSHRNKVDLLRRAVEAGRRTCLYFIATSDPKLNVLRVHSRVEVGGHDVPADKVVARYHRSLALLPDAMRFAHRAFLFDNSGGAPEWLAERTPEGTLALKVTPDSLPDWFRTHVLPNSTLAEA